MWQKIKEKLKKFIFDKNTRRAVIVCVTFNAIALGAFGLSKLGVIPPSFGEVAYTVGTILANGFSVAYATNMNKKPVTKWSLGRATFMNVSGRMLLTHLLLGVSLSATLIGMIGNEACICVGAVLQALEYKKHKEKENREQNAITPKTLLEEEKRNPLQLAEKTADRQPEKMGLYAGSFTNLKTLKFKIETKKKLSQKPKPEIQLKNKAEDEQTL